MKTVPISGNVIIECEPDSHDCGSYATEELPMVFQMKNDGNIFMSLKHLLSIF
ncbi:MAG: hypothetical protein KAX28_00680 [Candidatus Marinimicrobia bacterium]|nr:hypothetical protein [Candidatus Neomarinimicrobiota bacterium]